MFFNTHQCNEHCAKLGLLNPRLSDKVPAGFKLIAEPSEEEVSMPGYTPVHKLCDLCRKPFETTFKHYAEKRNQGFELWCETCTQKRDDSFKKANCVDCSKEFKSSAYWFQMKKTDFPTKCSACRLANREKMRAQLEGTYVAMEDQSERSTVKNAQAPQQAFDKIIHDWESNFPALPQ